MPRLRWFRVLAAVALSIVAGCSAPAPPPGPPSASAVALYTLAESNRGKPQDIRHGEPVDVGWHAASGTFLVATYNDGTIYRGRLADPDVPVYMTGTLGQTVAGIAVAGDLLYAAGSISGQIRVYDLATRAQVGRFETGSGGEVLDLAVTGSGDVWATDGTRPVLWHLTAQQAAQGSGTPSALPLTPEIAFTRGPTTSAASSRCPTGDSWSSTKATAASTASTSTHRLPAVGRSPGSTARPSAKARG